MQIVDQVLTVKEAFDKRVSNVVFMGMGEPMLNMPSVMRAYGEDEGAGDGRQAAPRLAALCRVPRTCTCMYVCMYVCIKIYIYICIDIYTHAHACMPHTEAEYRLPPTATHHPAFRGAESPLFEPSM